MNIKSVNVFAVWTRRSKAGICEPALSPRIKLFDVFVIFIVAYEIEYFNFFKLVLVI